MQTEKKKNKQTQNHKMSNDHQKTNTYFHNAYISIQLTIGANCEKYYTFQRYAELHETAHPTAEQIQTRMYNYFIVRINMLHVLFALCFYRQCKWPFGPSVE